MKDAMLDLGKHSEGIVLTVKVHPGARRTGVSGIHAGALKVQVTENPERGKATEAVMDLLIDALKIRRDQISLISGATHRQKRFLIMNISKEEIEKCLTSLL